MPLAVLQEVAQEPAQQHIVAADLGQPALDFRPDPRRLLRGQPEQIDRNRAVEGRRRMVEAAG